MFHNGNMSIWLVTNLHGVEDGMRTLVLVVTWCTVLNADKHLVTQMIGLGF